MSQSLVADPDTQDVKKGGPATQIDEKRLKGQDAFTFGARRQLLVDSQKT